MPQIAWDNKVIVDGQCYSLRSLLSINRSVFNSLPSHKLLALVGKDELTLLAAAAWLAVTEQEGLVLPYERLTNSVREVLVQAGFTIADVSTGMVADMGDIDSRSERVHLLTSGSTGKPKLITHTWQSLFTMSRLRKQTPLNWLLTYLPGTYAWYQLVTLVLFVNGQSLTLSSDFDVPILIAEGRRSRVTAISATPTFWRLALLQAAKDDILGLNLKQISLGGEAADQAILDDLRSLFPESSIVHIYASTEAGASIVVRDGRAGFPSEWLNNESRVQALRVKDGHLWIRSPYAAQGFDDWLDTQDIAVVRGDRVYILGREGYAQINVGGGKVLAADVERCLLTHPYVLWCRVKGIRAPLVGQLVVAEIVPRPEHLNAPVPEDELTQHCMKYLAHHMVPRVWERLDNITFTANWKTEVMAR